MPPYRILSLCINSLPLSYYFSGFIHTGSYSHSPIFQNSLFLKFFFAFCSPISLALHCIVCFTTHTFCVMNMSTYQFQVLQLQDKYYELVSRSLCCSPPLFALCYIFHVCRSSLCSHFLCTNPSIVKMIQTTHSSRSVLLSVAILGCILTSSLCVWLKVISKEIYVCFCVSILDIFIHRKRIGCIKMGVFCKAHVHVVPSLHYVYLSC